MIALLLDIPPPRQRATGYYLPGGNSDRGCSCARGGDRNLRFYQNATKPRGGARD